MPTPSTSTPGSIPSSSTPATPSSSTAPSEISVDGTISLPTYWRPDVEFCLQEKCLTDSARNDMVRTFANLLIMKYGKPSIRQCEELARRVILKYPFLKDDIGNGYVSLN